MKKFIGMALAAVISASSFTALAAGAIPDHQGTSMDGIEIGTAQLNSAVKSYYDLFEQAGDQYGVDPNLLAAICMQESSGRNLSYRDDGSEYPAWVAPIFTFRCGYPIELRTCSNARPAANIAKVLANGTMPVVERPAAIPIILHSAIPQSM